MTDMLNLTGEYAYFNDFEVRLRALTNLTRVQRVFGTTLFVGGIKYASLVVRVLRPELLSRKSVILQALC